MTNSFTNIGLTDVSAPVESAGGGGCGDACMCGDSSGSASTEAASSGSASSDTASSGSASSEAASSGTASSEAASSGTASSEATSFDTTSGADAAAPAAQEFLVTGMTCGHCVSSITEELGELDGVDAVAVELNAGGASKVQVSSSAPLDVEKVRAAVAEAGYELVGASA